MHAGQRTAKTQKDPEPSCHFRGAGGESRVRAGPLPRSTTKWGDHLIPTPAPPDPPPPLGGAPVTAFASLRYTLSCDPPLASGQCLLIRVLEPWSATKVGEKGALLLSTALNAILRIPTLPQTEVLTQREDQEM